MSVGVLAALACLAWSGASWIGLFGIAPVPGVMALVAVGLGVMAAALGMGNLVKAGLFKEQHWLQNSYRGRPQSLGGMVKWAGWEEVVLMEFLGPPLFASAAALMVGMLVTLSLRSP